MAVMLRYTQSFKKYTSEYDPKLVEHVRTWAQGQSLIAFHEDNSLVKVTGTKAQVDELLEQLKELFGYLPPDRKKK